MDGVDGGLEGTHPTIDRQITECYSLMLKQQNTKREKNYSLLLAEKIIIL